MIEIKGKTIKCSYEKDYKITRSCMVCGEATESIDVLLCKRCQQAIWYARRMMENQGVDNES